MNESHSGLLVIKDNYTSIIDSTLRTVILVNSYEGVVSLLSLGIVLAEECYHLSFVLILFMSRT